MKVDQSVNISFKRKEWRITINRKVNNQITWIDPFYCANRRRGSPDPISLLSLFEICKIRSLNIFPSIYIIMNNQSVFLTIATQISHFLNFLFTPLAQIKYMSASGNRHKCDTVA